MLDQKLHYHFNNNFCMCDLPLSLILFAQMFIQIYLDLDGGINNYEKEDEVPINRVFITAKLRR